MVTEKGATDTKTSLVFPEDGKTVKIAFSDGSLSESKNTKYEIAKLISEHAKEKKPQIPMSEVESLLDQVMENPSLDHGKGSIIMISTTIESRRPSFMDMLAMMLTNVFKEDEMNVKEPTFVPCPACGDHGKVFMPDGDHSPSLRSSRLAHAWIKTLKQHNKLNEKQYKKVLAEIEEMKEWREE